MYRNVLNLCRSVIHRNLFFNKKLTTADKKFSNFPMDIEANRIVWIDLEMTGLDIKNCHILEIACLVTDSELNIIAEGPELIIHQPDEILDNMDEWCIEHHGKSGLTNASKNSNVILENAEIEILKFLNNHVQSKMSPLAGNSVYMDKLFLNKYMPQVCDYLHYRIIDVSTVKELCRRWNPNIYKDLPKKRFLHRSLSDIKESVQELRWWKERFFNCNSENGENFKR